ncbi:hypothetical protein MUN74_00660 [Agromyces endophyticus]|uniref:hypothetical protein n=1 Tax=Agromyces sp. H17E-10 TaxID=2932244 RepID=UPI001FD5C941|nr:hypothetical protein [Agromyces sp. H17E-10]UOQ89472.1 hypothetical protein MUN74_00660 [Agromyces sp. H17E-10]
MSDQELVNRQDQLGEANKLATHIDQLSSTESRQNFDLIKASLDASVNRLPPPDRAAIG